MRVAAAGGVVGHYECSRSIGIASQMSELLQRGELVRDAAGGGKSNAVADLANARGVAPVGDRGADHVEDRTLSGGETGIVGRTVGKLG
jgi:hypothetical protein